VSRLLEAEGLHVTFNPPTGPVRAIRGVSLEVGDGEIVGVAGESGCGKSVLFRALLGLLPDTARVEGRLLFDGKPMGMDGSLQGAASLIYQNPGASLNPVFTIGQQLRLVAGTDDPAVLGELLEQVGLPDAPRLLASFPHELSGGMSQRAVIALALAQSPRLLIADEPTTSLDVTTQLQVLDLIEELQDRSGLAVVLISHDLAVLRRVCERIVVLYAGQIAEDGRADQVLGAPSHPYTRALLESIPRPETTGRQLASIPGLVPDGRMAIGGCAFAPRCSSARDACRAGQPEPRPVQPGHQAACILVGRGDTAANDHVTPAR
jgi:oligopeptide/dipeptide ABC transporter ATP-binding protein